MGDQRQRLFPVQWLPLTAAVLGGATIVLCYLIAVFVEGRTPWLLYITDYSRYVPAVFFFRAGMMPGAALFSVIMVLCGSWVGSLATLQTTPVETRTEYWCRECITWCGGLSGIAFVCSISVMDGDDSKMLIHVITIGVFLLLNWVAEVAVMITLGKLKSGGAPVSENTLLWRKIIVAIRVVNLTIFIVSLAFSWPSWVPALGEWIGIFSLLLSVHLLYYDWKDIFYVETCRVSSTTASPPTSAAVSLPMLQYYIVPTAPGYSQLVQQLPL
eukprot:TRINITY_DN18811_c0_g1_i1.p1 TRINITY_DN18811_c0_g1~~TRINITY_DN18811_c0_g1_i1.p1  ORF type:complete len:305 (-),score=44.86 TRINITY_DN18811_c0_g1_i1:86-898(-)